MPVLQDAAKKVLKIDRVLPVSLSDRAIHALCTWDYASGNVRELRNLLANVLFALNEQLLELHGIGLEEMDEHWEIDEVLVQRAKDMTVVGRPRERKVAR
jgi:DNA-binding NtrC family response regulator